MATAFQVGEPPLDRLLQAHKGDIYSILGRIGALDSGGTCVVDELFVLRFLLSDRENAEENILKTLEWRRRNAQTLLEAQRGNIPFEAEMSRHVKRGTCGWLADQYLVMIVRAGHGNSVNIMRELSMEQTIQNMLFHHEHIMAMVDKKTRDTGRLCKVVYVMDFQGFTLRYFDRRFAKANGDMTHLINLYYPQMIKSIALVNLPATFRIMYSFAKMFASRSALEKQMLCPARTRGRSARDCPFLARFGPDAASQVPSFLGGHHPTPFCLQLGDEMEIEGASKGPADPCLND